MAEQKKYTEGAKPRKAENFEDRVIEEKGPVTVMRAAKSPDPTGRSRMKLRTHNPDPEKVQYYL